MRTLHILLAQLSKRPVRRCLLAEDGKCSSTIVKAHSVQNSFVLDQLQDEGHVYMIEGDRDTPFPILKLLGRNKATAFTGFCSWHDNELFKDIDLADTCSYGRNNPRQACLYFLRSCAHEYWKKLNIIENLEQILAGNVSGFVPPGDKVSFYEFLSNYIKEQHLGVRDMKIQFESLLFQLQSNKYHLTLIKTYTLNNACRFAASAVCTPYCDFIGHPLFEGRPEIQNHRWPIFSILVLPLQTETIVQFCTHRKDLVLFEKFIKSLDMSDVLECQKAISKGVVSLCENIVLAPKLIRSMSDSEKHDLCRVFMETTMSTSNGNVPNLF